MIMLCKCNCVKKKVGFGSKLGQISGSRSKYNIFRHTTGIYTQIRNQTKCAYPKGSKIMIGEMRIVGSELTWCEHEGGEVARAHVGTGTGQVDIHALHLHQLAGQLPPAAVAGDVQQVHLAHVELGTNQTVLKSPAYHQRFFCDRPQQLRVFLAPEIINLFLLEVFSVGEVRERVGNNNLFRLLILVIFYEKN